MGSLARPSYIDPVHAGVAEWVCALCTAELSRQIWRPRRGVGLHIVIRGETCMEMQLSPLPAIGDPMGSIGICRGFGERAVPKCYALVCQFIMSDVS